MKRIQRRFGPLDLDHPTVRVHFITAHRIVREDVLCVGERDLFPDTRKKRDANTKPLPN